MNEFSDALISVHDFYVLDEDGNPWLKDLRFKDCRIVGPALLLLTPNNGSQFIGCTLDAQMFWPLDDGDRNYLGCIGLLNVAFENCHFVRVGHCRAARRYRQFLLI